MARTADPVAALLRLDAASRPALTLIVADRGAGKTSILRRWERQIEQEEGVPVVFVDAASSSIRGTALGPVFDELGTADQAHFVMIDSLDRCTDRDGLERLVEVVDRGTHRFAIATRTSGDLPLHRWRSSERLVELGTVDLRLSSEAIRELAADRGLALEAEVAARIYEATEGWAEGVACVLDGVANEPGGRTEDAIETVVSRCALDLAAWLEEELDPAEFGILMQTSILGAFDQALGSAVCAAVSGADVVDEVDLATLVRRAPFVGPIDEGGREARVHPMARLGLRLVLEQRETPREIAARHLAAACHLADVGEDRSAIEHSVEAGRPDVAADILARMWARDHRKVTDEDIDRLTAAGVGDHVPHLLTRACSHLRSGDYDAVRLLSQRLNHLAWQGPLPHGFADLESAVVFVNANLPEMTIAHLVDYVDAPKHRPELLAAAGALVPGYTAAHYCYWLGRIEEAMQRVESVQIGHRSVGRHRLEDKITTVLSFDLSALIRHDRGEIEAAADDVASSDALLSEYQVDIGALSRKALDVHELAWAVSGSGPVDERIATLERLRNEAETWDVRVHAAIEVVRLLDSLTRFGEALEELDVLEDVVEAREQPLLPLHASRRALLRAALLPSNRRVPPVVDITASERAILYHLADQSLPQDEIAARLGLSINTVKSHLRNIYRKLGVGSRGEAITEAAHLGMLVTIEPWDVAH